MELGICSYSFHRLLEAGEQDIFGYFGTCKALGVTHLEPWSGHFAASGQARGEPPKLGNAEHAAYLKKIKDTAEALNMPFGCIAVDGAHIYEDSEEARQANKRKASQWLEIADYLGARQLRVDAGYRGDSWPDDVFAIIVAGYKDFLSEAEARGVEVIIENHWGPSQHPEELLTLLEAVKGLGLLFDTHNWAAGKQMQGWESCAKYARAVHIKTLSFDANGRDPSVDLAKAIRLLRESGYSGVWSVESVPTNGDELEAARMTLELIQAIRDPNG